MGGQRIPSAPNNRVENHNPPEKGTFENCEGAKIHFLLNAITPGSTWKSSY